MNREEMLKELEAGELPTDVCIKKYRELLCRVQNGEKLEGGDIGINTCALCHEHYYLSDGCKDTCPLFKTGNGCLDKSHSPYRNLSNLVNPYFTDEWHKDKVLDAIEDMITALKKAKEYEKVEEQTYHIGQKFLCDGDEYVLCTPKYQKIGLINPKTGNRWGDSTEVKDIHRITEKEMLKHTSSWDRFLLVK